jgi:activator of 2-hydroxyglutaryl-CoA dehydratase
MGAKFSVGLDVGSTTVKACVLDTASDTVVWQDYQRHETKQPEKVLEFLRRMEADAGIGSENTRMFMTGSGGTTLADRIGAKFVQEVTAVSLAVEKLHPEVYSVIELGGQDAKIIVFKDDDESGRKKKIPSMNDKCAGGTGAVIDKINAKLKIPVEELANQGYHGIKLHKVAGKCGVFAETDINGLQKEGTPPDQLMASLFEAIVLQNLSVLTRGHTLRPHVLLLGGPNSFIRGMREAWVANIPRMWKERKVEIPEGSKPDDLIKVPQNAQYFAAMGAIEFGKDEEDDVGRYKGPDKLAHYIDFGRAEEKAAAGGKGCIGRRSLFRPLFHAGRSWRDLSASTAGPRQPKPRWSTKTATSCARRTSFQTATPSKTRSRCSTSSVPKLRIRARSSKCWASEPPATRRTF